MPLFVILFQYLAEASMTFQPFWPKFPFFAQHLPFSNDRRLSRFPSLSPHLRFCKTFDGFLPFSPICQFRENCQLPIGLFCCLINFFARPLMNPCQIREFRKICHFRKTHNYRHASFFILFQLGLGLQIFYKFLPNLPFS